MFKHYSKVRWTPLTLPSSDIILSEQRVFNKRDKYILNKMKIGQQYMQNKES